MDELHSHHRTMEFRAVDGTSLCADVYSPQEPSGTGGVLLWFHGGALILGSRADAPSDVLDVVLAAGGTFVSVDYRLAPQATIDDIASDAAAAWDWVCSEAEPLGANPHRIMVGGVSAGGFLALHTGLNDRRPQAVLAYYGYGTLDSPWYTTPSDYYRTLVPLVDELRALDAVGDQVVVDGHQRPDAAQFYFYCRQNGLWPQLAAGVALPDERDVLRRYSPTYRVTSEYPETLLIHGTDDHDVPHSESAAMAAMLELHDVRHECISLVGFDHGLDPGDDPAKVAALSDAAQRATEFITLHLTGP